MTALQEKILTKRREGMTYRAIAEAIPCSAYAVYYACCKADAAPKSLLRNNDRRRKNTAQLKAAFGAQCAVCGYDRCAEALEFDHLFPEQKIRPVSSLRSRKKAEKEAEKCLLLCCRCHRERHAGLLDIGAYLAPST